MSPPGISRPTLSQSEIPAESSASSDIRLSVKKLTPSTNPAVFVDGIDFFRLLSTKRGLFVDVRTDHVHELLAFLYKPASSKSRMFAVPIHISLPQGRCAHGSHDIRCIMGIADAHVRKFRNVILNEVKDLKTERNKGMLFFYSENNLYCTKYILFYAVRNYY